MDQLLDFVQAMLWNLDRFDIFLFDMGVDEQNPFQRMAEQYTSVLQVLRSAVHDRLELKRHVDRLKDIGATFHETKVKNDPTAISNSQWLTKVTISHAECQDLLEHMELESLKRHGDIVFNIPRDMPKLEMSWEGQLRSVRRGDMVYVGFLDIGIRSELTTRRMHLRATPDNQVSWENPETASGLLENVQSVLSRFLGHVRNIDVQLNGRDREGCSLSESYDLSIWIGPLDKRMEYLSMHLPGNRSSSFAARSVPWHSRDKFSGGSGSSVGSNKIRAPWRLPDGHSKDDRKTGQGDKSV